MGSIKQIGRIRHGKIRNPFPLKVKVNFTPSQNLDLFSDVFLELVANYTSLNKCSVIDLIDLIDLIDFIDFIDI